MRSTPSSSREERYKAKSLIDTLVYRGGDATSATAHALLKSTFGLGLTGIAWCGARTGGDLGRNRVVARDPSRGAARE